MMHLLVLATILVDSVRSFVPVASEMPSYLEMSKIALLGSDHGKLINSFACITLLTNIRSSESVSENFQKQTLS